MSFQSSLGAALLLATVASSAQQLAPPEKAVASKPAWQLTDEERISARLDPEKIQQRAAHHAAAQAARHGSGLSSSLAATSAQQANFRIDGAENPELFLPFELLNDLVRGVDMHLTAADRNVARAILHSNIKSFGYDPDAFWNALGLIMTRYFEVRDSTSKASENKRARSEATPLVYGSNEPYIGLCRERLAALNAARDHFGRDTFDRFLYQVVAPTVSSSSRVPDEAQGLRYIAGGCQ